MVNAFTAAVARMRTAGWTVEPAGPRPIPEPLSHAPAAQVTWASSFSRLSSPDDATWFLSLEDYAGSSTDAFVWNAFELLSREAAASDEEQSGIAEFWSRHRPILLSVRDRYSYLAIRDDGVIVHGEEPEFDQTIKVAGDLDTLLRTVAAPPEPGVGLIETLLFGPGPA